VGVENPLVGQKKTQRGRKRGTCWKKNGRGEKKSCGKKKEQKKNSREGPELVGREGWTPVTENGEKWGEGRRGRSQKGKKKPSEKFPWGEKAPSKVFFS